MFLDMETTPTTYNGWKNYETWNVSLWIDNDAGSYNYVRELADECKTDAPDHHNTGNVWTEDETARFLLADRLKDMIEEATPDLGASMFSDLLNAALSEVDWIEIAENILAES